VDRDMDIAPSATKRKHYRDLAIRNGIKMSTFYSRLDYGWDLKKAATKRLTKNDEFAVYKGDDLIVMGTAKECARFMGVTEKYIGFMTTPTGKRRMEGRNNPENATTAERIPTEMLGRLENG